MNIIENESFINQDIELDGNGYENCSFTNCNFIFRGNAAFGLSNPTLNNVTMAFTDGAALTVQAFNQLYKAGGSFQQWVEYELNSIDGSFGSTKH